MDSMKPKWETLEGPTLWSDLTPEQRRMFLAGEISVWPLSLAEIRAMYGPPIPPLTSSATADTVAGPTRD